MKGRTLRCTLSANMRSKEAIGVFIFVWILESKGCRKDSVAESASLKQWEIDQYNEKLCWCPDHANNVAQCLICTPLQTAWNWKMNWESRFTVTLTGLQECRYCRLLPTWKQWPCRFDCTFIPHYENLPNDSELPRSEPNKASLREFAVFIINPAPREKRISQTRNWILVVYFGWLAEYATKPPLWW